MRTYTEIWSEPQKTGYNPNGFWYSFWLKCNMPFVLVYCGGETISLELFDWATRVHSQQFPQWQFFQAVISGCTLQRCINYSQAELESFLLKLALWCSQRSQMANRYKNRSWSGMTTAHWEAHACLRQQKKQLKYHSMTMVRKPFLFSLWLCCLSVLIGCQPV